MNPNLKLFEKDLYKYTCDQLLCIAKYHNLNPQEPLARLITKIAEANSKLELRVGRLTGQEQELFDAVLFDNIVRVQQLLDQQLLGQGVSPNDSGDTLLHLAMYKGNTEMVKILLSAGANINAQNNYGNTPLHLASYHGDTEIVEILLIAGADPNIQNIRNETADIDPEILEEINKKFGSLEQAHQYWLKHILPRWSRWQLSQTGRRVIGMNT